MADAAIMSTCGVSTVVERQEHPMALSAKHKEAVERTWKFVEEIGLMEAGILLFKKIFDICPAALELFPKFNMVPIEELEENEDFRAHGLQVVEAVALAVSSLDEMDGLIDILKDLGSVHCPLGIKDPHFDVVGEAFLWTLETGLGEDVFTPEVKEAWTTFYKMVADAMKEGLHAAYAACQSDN